MDLSPVAKNNLLQSPQLLEAQFERRASLMNLAAKTTLVAIALIAIATATIVFLGLTLTGATPFFLLGSILTTPFLMQASSRCAAESEKAAKNAENEKQVGAALKEFENLDQQQFDRLCRQIAIDPTSSPYTPDQFNILMARFGFWNQRALTSLEKANRHIYRDSPESAQQKINESNATPEQASLLRFTIRDAGFRILENEVIPAMLESALILQVLKDANQPPSLSSIGTLHPKSMAYRLSENLYDNNDVYMTFSDPFRDPLASREIVNLFHSGGSLALQQRMFA